VTHTHGAKGGRQTDSLPHRLALGDLPQLSPPTEAIVVDRVEASSGLAAAAAAALEANPTECLYHRTVEGEAARREGGRRKHKEGPCRPLVL